MNPTSRRATVNDIPHLVGLYRLLETEQAALRQMWPYADGLPEPVADSFRELLADDIVDGDGDSLVVIGEVDGVPLGFAWCRSESLLPQGEGQRVAAIRLIHTVAEARGVGVGDAMITMVLDEFRQRGHRLFDAHVSPGHRHAKNFFESNGFSARLIVMHHADVPLTPPSHPTDAPGGPDAVNPPTEESPA